MRAGNAYLTNCTAPYAHRPYKAGWEPSDDDNLPSLMGGKRKVQVNLQDYSLLQNTHKDSHILKDRIIRRP